MRFSAHTMGMGPKHKSLLGQKFGMLLPMEFCRHGKNLRAAYLCQCDCGGQSIVFAQSLRGGFTRSCGCQVGAERIKHGLSREKVYSIWQGMKQRCDSDKMDSYPRYGGRGITYCDEWKYFENFYADMGPMPTPDHSIDRIDNNKGYFPNNCRWATDEEQMLNREITILIPYQGRMLTVNKLSAETGISRNTIRARVKYGWSPDEIISPPRNDRIFLEIGGERRLMTEWAKITGLKLATISRRFRLGLKGEDLIAPLLRPKKGGQRGEKEAL